MILKQVTLSILNIFGAFNFSTVLLLLALLVIAVLVLRIIRLKKRLGFLKLRNIALQNDNQSKEAKVSAVRALILDQEKERIRISEELHDRLGGTLSAARMWNEAALKEMKESDVMEVQKLLDQAIDDARAISHSILPGVLSKFGLVAALEDYINGTDIPKSLKVNLAYGQLPNLSISVSLKLYRILQEVVKNSIKHTYTKNLDINLEHVTNQLVISIKDDGVGADEKKYSYDKVFKSINNWLEVLSGELDVKTTRGVEQEFIIRCIFLNNDKSNTHKVDG